VHDSPPKNFEHDPDPAKFEPKIQELIPEERVAFPHRYCLVGAEK